MPYIKSVDRDSINSSVENCIDFDGIEITNCGELNYVLSVLCHGYLYEHGMRYQNINEVIGVLECMKLELYRQIAAPYEDIKKAENGSVSELDK
jgi:hypothetical protein